jgi:hypothetical protein
MAGGAILAGPTHLDDERIITARILRQNAQTSLKGASAIHHRSGGAVSTRSARITHREVASIDSATYNVQKSGANDRFPYVDGPLLARLFGQCSDQIACVHMSGLFSRSHMNAGQDGFRDASSKHPSDLWRPVESTECLASWID